MLCSPDMGLLMARFYVAFETMKSFCNLTGGEDVATLLSLISQSKDFAEIQLRVNEKKTLNRLNKCKDSPVIRFPMNGRIKTKDMKINWYCDAWSHCKRNDCTNPLSFSSYFSLIQAIFGCLNIQDPSLMQEVHHIMKIGHRVSKCTC